MHFRNSFTRNSNHLIFLIKAGNALEERMLSQTIINTFKSSKRDGFETETKVMVAAKWWLFLQ